MGYGLSELMRRLYLFREINEIELISIKLGVLLDLRKSELFTKSADLYDIEIKNFED